MTITLTKTQSTEWKGNGFGSSAASWAIKGAEHIAITGGGGGFWYAIEEGKRIASGSTRRELLDCLAFKRPELLD